MPFFGLAWQTEPKRRDSSLSRGLPYVNDVMGFLPFAYLMFFPFLDFPCSFSRMINILKAIDESSSQHGIAVTYLHTEERSWVFPQSVNFWRIFFSSMVVVIISWPLFRRRQHILIEYLMNSASFYLHVFASNYEQYLHIYILLTRSESRTLTLS